MPNIYKPLHTVMILYLLITSIYACIFVCVYIFVNSVLLGIQKTNKEQMNQYWLSVGNKRVI